MEQKTIKNKSLEAGVTLLNITKDVCVCEGGEPTTTIGKGWEMARLIREMSCAAARIIHPKNIFRFNRSERKKVTSLLSLSEFSLKSLFSCSLFYFN